MLAISKATHKRYEIIMDILSFKSLHEKWDGFDAIPMEVKSATNAIKLMDYIGENIFCDVTNYYPNPNGTITFEWENKRAVYSPINLHKNKQRLNNNFYRPPANSNEVSVNRFDFTNAGFLKALAKKFQNSEHRRIYFGF